MMLKFLMLAYWLGMAIAAPQFITFKDGKIGVNFGGYHADAGLGGLLTGNAAHGGLSASAGTPYGQRAGAGLGGSVDDNASGFLYAGAEANPQVGAGAVLGGDTSKGGFMGAQAFSNGKTVASTKSHTFTKTLNGQLETMGNDDAVQEDIKRDVPVTVYSVQKVKPPKKYHVNKHRIAVQNRADDISTIVFTTKNPNHNDDDSNDYDTGGVATTKKGKSPNVVDVQHPERSGTTPDTAAGFSTTKSVSYVESSNKAVAQLSPPSKSPPPQAPAPAKSKSTPTTNTHVVVSKQRLRQKSRLRSQLPHKLQRQQQRQRQRLQQAQRANHGTEIETRVVGDGAYKQQEQQQTDALVQQYAQYYTPNTEANIPQTRYLIKNVEKPQLDYPAASTSTSAEAQLNIRPAVVTSALQIPIGILRSLQESLGGLSVSKQASVRYN